ncbi:MAG: alpha/beta hydrolase [Rhizobiaceae bacterium]
MMRETADPAALAGKDARFAQVDGIAIRYRRHGPDDGMPVVLIHGTLAWGETWRDIAAPLGEAGYRVIMPDIPPFGFSERPDDHDYSRQAQALLMTGLLDSLALERPVLVGHSFGGGGTVEAAASRPAEIRALVLIDVALGLSVEARKEPWFAPAFRIGQLRTALASATFANPLLVPSGLRAFVADDSVVTGERVELYRRPLATTGTSEAIGDWMKTGLYGTHEGAATLTPAGLAVLDMPTLIIWGRQDTVTPLAQGEEIAALLPDARLVVLDGVNHIPHIERPMGVLAALLPFLAEQRAGTVSDLRP